MELYFKKENDCLIVEVVGRLDTFYSSEFEERTFEEISRLSPNKLIIDCKKLEYISSAGLRSIITLSKKTEIIEEVRLINCSDEIKEIFVLTGLISLVNIDG